MGLLVHGPQVMCLRERYQLLSLRRLRLDVRRPTQNPNRVPLLLSSDSYLRDDHFVVGPRQVSDHLCPWILENLDFVGSQYKVNHGSLLAVHPLPSPCPCPLLWVRLVPPPCRRLPEGSVLDGVPVEVPRQYHWVRQGTNLPA